MIPPPPHPQAAEDVNAYLSQPDYLATLERQPGVRRTTLESIRSNLVDKPLRLEDCVVWARCAWCAPSR